jgi:hypothetical protein
MLFFNVSFDLESGVPREAQTLPEIVALGAGVGLGVGAGDCF